MLLPLQRYFFMRFLLIIIFFMKYILIQRAKVYDYLHTCAEKFAYVCKFSSI